ncbi:MliC family protein [Marinibacterium sp. SX1]|uniref:MliC family protein n=1 Tax=Marinibacterium sp. SX1 TaxID=3388424 RepID=UPI003D18740C
MLRTATGLTLLLWPLAAMAQPSFDCSKAESSAEEAVCASDALSAMDVETARLFDLALHGPDMTMERAQELRAYQRGWIKGRDECWKADDLALCIRDEYALRIDALRTGYADARATPGASTGPFAYVCDGLDAAVSATYVQAGDPVVVLRWGDNARVLPQVISGSGARYEADGLQFWTKGPDATLTQDGADHACRQDGIG